MKFIIESVQAKVSAKGKPFTSIKTSVGSMTCWDATLNAQLVGLIGKEVEAEVAEKDGFKTLKSITTFTEVVECLDEVPKENHTFNRDRLIVRQSSLKAAVDFNKSAECTAEQILELAEAFEEWVFR